MERRLAAILLTDMVGYSRLMGLDEEGTIARQQAHRDEVIDPRIATHGGRIVKTTGDGLLVEFPSLVDAVKCAVEVQKELANRDTDLPEDRRIQYRIGINLGDIVIDGNDILGDGVNVAARLEGLAKPGGICISGTVYEHLAGKIDIAFEDAGEQKIKNVPRPVHVWRWPSGAAANETRMVLAPPSKSSMFIMAGFVLVSLISGLAWWHLWNPSTQVQPQQEPALTTKIDKPVIAVLPFDNMSQSPEQDYFSDGITEDIITDLSRISGLLVIARNSTFAYKGTATKIKQIARELGASHVLTGSVRKAGKRIRINAQLIDAATKHEIWADRYDRQLSDVFALQDEVTQRIVSSLSVKLKLSERDRLSRSAKVDPEAYDMLLRGIDRYRRLTREAVTGSREFFKKAIALDKNFARAHADLALTYVSAANLGLSDQPKASLRKALEIANFALKLDDRLPQTHFVLAAAYRGQRQYDKAIAAARRSIALDPNYADGYFQVALNLNYAGRPDDGLTEIKKAMRLNPRHSFFYVLVLGQSYYLLGEYEKALKQFERAKAANPEFGQVHKFLAATYVALGRMDDAEWAVEELKSIIPDVSLKKEVFSAPFQDKRVLDLYLSRLRKAGLE
jgi:adenylate cyclase